MSLKPRNLTEQLVETLGLRIVSGDYPVGNRLPSEQYFGEEFEVSRPILREVTKVLMAKGLVESRSRIGTTVRARESWSMLDPDVLRWTIQSLPEQAFIDFLFDTRMVYEPGAAALAAKNATSDDLNRIRSAYEAMEDADTASDLLDPDLQFHQAIVDATQNPFLAHIGRTLYNALRYSIELTSRHPQTHDLSLPRHKAVCDAILMRDGEKAGRAMQVLLEESRRDFIQVRDAGEEGIQ
ncbi:MAG: FadR/GntR family transcriptional regulator [Hyphomonas sp.]|uniref:FadR/GntR family transcriptional regulator n=1 Tax=Hyphomonas sp. TaxID=87 RepID=UPI0035287D33